MPTIALSKEIGRIVLEGMAVPDGKSNRRQEGVVDLDDTINTGGLLGRAIQHENHWMTTCLNLQAPRDLGYNSFLRLSIEIPEDVFYLYLAGC